MIENAAKRKERSMHRISSERERFQKLYRDFSVRFERTFLFFARDRDNDETEDRALASNDDQWYRG